MGGREEMAEITLIRHGRSTHIEKQRINHVEFQNWVEKYDSSGVFEETTYPSLTCNKIQSAHLIVTSDLKRSIDSAKLLHKEKQKISKQLFRETELPVLSKEVRLKLKPNSWAIILRCLWFCGYSKQCESFKEAKQRANKAAKQLINDTEKHSSVVLVGHGLFNRLIARELRKLGWKGKRKSSVKNWGSTTYYK